MNALTRPRLGAAGAWGAAVCLAAVLAATAALPGYDHRQHPLALLGARGIPTAWWFNWLGFVIPGALALLAAVALRARLDARAPWTARIGTGLLQLSALAFAAQGLLPLDPEDLEASAGRLHAGAWTLWWIAFVPGALLLAGGLRGDASRGRAVALAVAGVLVLMAGLPALLWPGPPVQRIAVAGWLLAYAALAGVRR